MDRRNFLQGVLGGVTAGGLVIAASPVDIQAFTSTIAPGSPVALGVGAGLGVRVGDHLYNASGHLVAVVTRAEYQVYPVEVTMAWDNSRVYLPGRRSVSLQAEGIGPWLK